MGEPKKRTRKVTPKTKTDVAAAKFLYLCYGGSELTIPDITSIIRETGYPVSSSHLWKVVNGFSAPVLLSEFVFMAKAMDVDPVEAIPKVLKLANRSYVLPNRPSEPDREYNQEPELPLRTVGKDGVMPSVPHTWNSVDEAANRCIKKYRLQADLTFSTLYDRIRDCGGEVTYGRLSCIIYRKGSPVRFSEFVDIMVALGIDPMQALREVLEEAESLSVVQPNPKKE